MKNQSPGVYTALVTSNTQSPSAQGAPGVGMCFAMGIVASSPEDYAAGLQFMRQMGIPVAMGATPLVEEMGPASAALTLEGEACQVAPIDRRLPAFGEQSASVEIIASTTTAYRRAELLEVFDVLEVPVGHDRSLHDLDWPTGTYRFDPVRAVNGAELGASEAEQKGASRLLKKGPNEPEGAAGFVVLPWPAAVA